MEMLYKYYSNQSDYAFENIENGVICFTPLISLNDPLEGLGIYKYITTKEEKNFWDSIGSNAPEALEQRFSQEIQGLLNFKHRIFSTSKECTNPLLWAHYANSHKGFCVGYEKTHIQNISDNVCDVDYCNQPPLINGIKSEDFFKLLFVKSRDWKYERESRAIYTLKEPDVSHLSAENYLNPNKDNDYIYILNGHATQNNLEMLCSPKYIIKECPPKAIYFGMNMSGKDKRRIFNISQKYDIKYYQIKYAHNTFKFIAEEIPKKDLELIFSYAQNHPS